MRLKIKCSTGTENEHAVSKIRTETEDWVDKRERLEWNEKLREMIVIITMKGWISFWIWLKRGCGF